MTRSKSQKNQLMAEKPKWLTTMRMKKLTRNRLMLMRVITIRSKSSKRIRISKMLIKPN